MNHAIGRTSFYLGSFVLNLMYISYNAPAAENLPGRAAEKFSVQFSPSVWQDYYEDTGHYNIHNVRILYSDLCKPAR